MKIVCRLLICFMLVGTVSCSVDSGGESPASGINVVLEITKAPALNEPVVVTVTVTAMADAPNARVYLNFGVAKVEVVDGQTQWNVDLKKDAPLRLTTTLKLLEERQYDIVAFADGNNLHGSASKQLVVARTGGSFNLPTVPPGPPRPADWATYTPQPLTPVTFALQRSISPQTIIADNGDWVTVSVEISDAPADAKISRVLFKYRIQHPAPVTLRSKVDQSSSPKGSQAFSPKGDHPSSPKGYH